MDGSAPTQTYHSQQYNVRRGTGTHLGYGINSLDEHIKIGEQRRPVISHCRTDGRPTFPEESTTCRAVLRLAEPDFMSSSALFAPIMASSAWRRSGESSDSTAEILKETLPSILCNGISSSLSISLRVISARRLYEKRRRDESIRLTRLHKEHRNRLSYPS